MQVNHTDDDMRRRRRHAKTPSPTLVTSSNVRSYQPPENSLVLAIDLCNFEQFDLPYNFE